MIYRPAKKKSLWSADTTPERERRESELFRRQSRDAGILSSMREDRRRRKKIAMAQSGKFCVGYGDGAPKYAPRESKNFELAGRERRFQDVKTPTSVPAVLFPIPASNGRLMKDLA